MKQIEIHSVRKKTNICRIDIDNIGLKSDGFIKIDRILKKYAKGPELYLGCYKIDGISLTKKEESEFRVKIYKFLQLYGKYFPIDLTIKKGFKDKYLQNELVVYVIPNSDVSRDILIKIFRYHLETILFCSKLGVEDFLIYYKNHLNNTWEDYIKKGFSDIMFAYADSGDFSIVFRTDIFEQDQLFEEIKKIVFDL